MRMRIKFNENGESISVHQDGSLFNIVDGKKIPVTDNPDIYDVAPSPVGRYRKVNGIVSPVTQQDVFNELPADQKRRAEYHPIGDQLDSLYKTLQGDPAYDGTELAAEIAHWQSVKDLHPKP